MDLGPLLSWADRLFIAGCVAGSFVFGWCWSLVEWFMRVDIRV